MNLTIPIDVIKAAVKAGSKNKLFASKLDTSWGSVDLDSKFLEKHDREVLLDVISKPIPRKKDQDPIDPKELGSLRNNLKTLEKLASASVGDKKFKNLRTLTEAIKTYFQKVPRHWFFFAEHADEMLAPYVMTTCEYDSGGRSGLPHVHIKGEFYKRGEADKKCFNIYRKNLTGVTLLEVLAEQGIAPASEELIQDYLKELELFKQLHSQTGEQFLAQSYGVTGYKDYKKEDSYGWHSRNDIHLEKGGEKSRVVMDELEFYTKKESQATQSTLFAKVDEDDDSYEEGDDEDDSVSDEQNKELEKTNVFLPVHPRVIVFDLKKHIHCEVHVSNLEPYVYDEKLEDKLVLPEERKALIDVLLMSAKTVQQDIIKGKSGGTVILCSGAPGTGKTLTAEVYSEVAHRPLYVVQCSQLGIDSGELERHLSLVLDRSTRWGAVLLIDEADVYIRERGGDLNQNAVVGVFLRLLEYYSGVLFLTTNMATIIDDAIISRVMAHVRYTVPKTDEEKIKIWKVLSEQYQVKLGADLIGALISAYPQISGRTIKQMLKLAKVLSTEGGKKLDLGLFQWLTQFQDLS